MKVGKSNENIEREGGMGGYYRQKENRHLVPKSGLGKDSWRRCYLSSILKDEVELGEEE